MPPAPIYFDHNATTPLHPEVLEAMLPYLREHHGNPSSIHAAGRETRAAIDDARDRLARLLGAKSHEIIFTGGGTESDNLAILGLARCHADRGRHLITCATEHHAVLHACEWLEKREGFRVTVLPVEPSGQLDPARLRAALTPETTLVSVMTANNETGVRHPVAELAQICREHGVLFHTDAIQTFGKEPLPPLGAGPFDAVSLTAHKFRGPLGAGLLWVRAGLSLDRLTHGGTHEGERRPGTENTPAIAGLARAAELAASNFTPPPSVLAPPGRGGADRGTGISPGGASGVSPDAASHDSLGTLRERLWQGLRALFPTAQRNGPPDHCLANTLNVSFPGLDGESLLMSLDLAGICASSGSACMVGSIQPSHVLLAMGVPVEIAQATVRFSLGSTNTRDEIEDALQRMERVFQRLRAAA